MTNDRSIKLNATLKNAVRAAVCNDQRWTKYREIHGLVAANLTRDQLFDAADLFGIDVSVVDENLRAVGAYNAPDAVIDDIDDLVAAVTAPAPVGTPSSWSHIVAHGRHAVVTAPPPAATAPDEDKDEDDTAPAPAPAPVDTAPADDTADDPAPMTVQSVLAPVYDLLSPRVLSDLSTVLAPLVAAANKPPVETIRYVETAPSPVDPDDCRIVDERAASDVFGAPDVAGAVSIWSAPAGVVDPDYVFNPMALSLLVMHSRACDDMSPARHATRPFFFGPAGTGKTTLAHQFAARTGRPFVRIALDRGTEAVELIGQRLITETGGTSFHDGALTSAMQIPGCVILLDEPSFLKPGVAAVLQTILDTGAVYLKEDGNRRVSLARGAMIIAADNTNLTGDATGRYQDTQVQNMALQDRFGYFCRIDFLPRPAEVKVLSSRTGISEKTARVMVDYASLTREQAELGQLTAGVGLRRLQAWAYGIVGGMTSAAAFHTAILNPADESDAETLRSIALNAINHDLLKG